VTLSIAGTTAALFVRMTTKILTSFSFIFLTNVLFRLPEKRKADLFAIRHSTKEEIENAANFFELFEQEAQLYKKQTCELLTHLPSKLLNGHTERKRRAAYLKKCRSK